MALLPDWLADVCLLVTMKLTMGANFYTYGYLRGSYFTFNTTSGKCELTPQAQPMLDFSLMLKYGVEFVLPLVGGLLCDCRLGELLSLRIAATVLLAASLYVTVINYMQQVCLSVLYYIGAVLFSAVNAFCVVVIAAVFKSSHGHMRSTTVACCVYYASAACGELLGLVPNWIRAIFPNQDITFVMTINAIVFGACSLLLRMDCLSPLRQSRFIRPSRHQMMKMLTRMAPFIFFVFNLGTFRGALDCYELRTWLNATQADDFLGASCNSIPVGYNISTVLSVIAVAVLCHFGMMQAGLKSTRTRVNAGLLACLVARATGILMLRLMQYHQYSRDVYKVLYAARSAIDGCANGVGLAAGYELMYIISPQNAKSFGMGLLFTAWSTGTATAGLMIFVLSRVPADNPVLPNGDQPISIKPLVVPHLILAICCLLMLLYNNFIFNKQLQREIFRNDEDQLQPLTDPSSSEPQALPHAEDHCIN